MTIITTYLLFRNNQGHWIPVITSPLVYNTSKMSVDKSGIISTLIKLIIFLNYFITSINLILNTFRYYNVRLNDSNVSQEVLGESINKSIETDAYWAIYVRED